MVQVVATRPPGIYLSMSVRYIMAFRILPCAMPRCHTGHVHNWRLTMAVLTLTLSLSAASYLAGAVIPHIDYRTELQQEAGSTERVQVMSPSPCHLYKCDWVIGIGGVMQVMLSLSNGSAAACLHS